MSVSAGSRFGPYEIVSLLGAGGMGEVYRARDTRLGRDVAVKLLPEHLTLSPEARQRFEREARAIAALSHPNICALYDVGREGDADYLVMELLEGEVLSERLESGPLPLEQTLRHGVEIAAALGRAHLLGFVHRDLKPGNVMLTTSGAKLLDFGLAKAFETPRPAESRTSAATTEEELTRDGAILGTLAYMAPEQLEGRKADTRSDIFAFGAVLYEMATGRKAFPGSSRASRISAIMTAEPEPISILQPAAPPALDRLVRTCLAKDPEDRWQSAHDVARELKWIAAGGSRAESPAPPTARRRGRRLLAWIAAALFGLGVPLVLFLQLRQPAAGTARSLKLSILPPEGKAFQPGSVVLSPDGTRLAFVAPGADGRNVLWIRPLDSLEARPLPGTERAFSPFWSPDSNSVGFMTPDKLKRIDASGGPPQVLCDARVGRGGTWNRDGVIVFSPYPTEGLFRVSEGGGAPAPLTKLDLSRRENSHRWPTFLPDGRHFLFVVRSAQSENRAIYVGSLDSGETTRLMSGTSNVLYAPSPSGSPGGFLLFEHDGWLVARPFDARRLGFTGEPVPIAPKVKGSDPLAAGTFTVSETGVLAYGSGTTALRQLAWVDRGGKSLGAVGAPGLFVGFALSPDGKRVALDLVNLEPGGREIWLMELAHGVASRLTAASATELSPVWSPDGSRIAFATSRGWGSTDIFQTLSSGAGRAEALLKSENRELPTDWSRDGQSLLFERVGMGSKSEVWILPLVGERKPAPVLQAPFNESQAVFSPDGRWIAYVSDESGRQEVYVQTSPASAAKWRISPDGGSQPQWRRDGREIFYLTADGRLMAAGVSPGVGFEAASPTPLFRTEAMNQDVVGTESQYAVTSDGRRFLVSSPVEGQRGDPLTVVLDWTAGLKTP
jgi:Tol biopolymer transport system component